jgi:hypothetical protein
MNTPTLHPASSMSYKTALTTRTEPSPEQPLLPIPRCSAEKTPPDHFANRTCSRCALARSFTISHQPPSIPLLRILGQSNSSQTPSFSSQETRPLHTSPPHLPCPFRLPKSRPTTPTTSAQQRPSLPLTADGKCSAAPTCACHQHANFRLASVTVLSLAS